MRNSQRVRLALVAALGLCASSNPGWSSELIPADLTLKTPQQDPPLRCQVIAADQREFARRSVKLKLAFKDDFESFDLSSHRWTPHHDGGYDWPVKRTYKQAGEQQFYVDAGYKGTSREPLGLNPFRLKDGILSIVADRTPPDKRPFLYDYEFTSGLLTTRHSFVQTYGYFEIRAIVPFGKALWPAFWLLPQDKHKWPPEIDVFEGRGSMPGVFSMSTHWREPDGQQKLSTCNVTVEDASKAFHTYGLLWEPTRLTRYVDRKPVLEIAAPPGYDIPMYMIVNLAVGSTVMSGVGQAGADTILPRSMEIDYVVAYTLEQIHAR